MSRIKLTDTMVDVVTTMSEGNPGALNVCMQLIRDSERIDPDAAMGGLGWMLSLDTHEIYGSHIWLFYKDICGESIQNMIAVMRADQLGQLAGVTRAAIKDAIRWTADGRRDYCPPFDFDTIIAAVRERLPRFGGQVDVLLT